MTTEVCTEWSVQLRGDLGVMGTEYRDEQFPLTEAEARRRLAWWREHRPDVESTLVSREVAITHGDWQPVVTAPNLSGVRDGDL